jgi:hypothetical protein
MASSSMSPRKKIVGKVSRVEASGISQQLEGDPYIIGATYDDTSRLLEKDEETLKWGEIYHMLKKSNFFAENEDL